MNKHRWCMGLLVCVLLCDGVGAVELNWLDANVPAVMPGVTWGVPWVQGQVPAGSAFQIKDKAGESVPVQSWPLAYWPDGSLKWSAHAVGGMAPVSKSYTLSPGTASETIQGLDVTETDDVVIVDTGVIRCVLAKQGEVLIKEMVRDNRVMASHGRLVMLHQNGPLEEVGTVQVRAFKGRVDRVTVEQQGPVRAVVRFEGKHAVEGRAWLPFVVRVYFYANSDAMRMMYTMVYDGDESRDFIRGLGVRFDVPMTDEWHNRHIRFVGENQGVFGEAVRGLTGLRRDPGRRVTQMQVAGDAITDGTRLSPQVTQLMDLIPAFGDYTLFQSTSKAFEITKRTEQGHTWLKSGTGGRASGLGYVGGPAGGLAFGLRNFWQSYPAQLDIRHAATQTAQVTVWMWAPKAGCMDLRFYHDGMGQDTYARQLEGLNITYEDYEPGFGTPMGVARTSELMFFVTASTPARDTLVDMAQAVQTPPMLTCSPDTLLNTGVFGKGLWSLPDRSTPAKAALEEQLDFYYDFYHKQVDQRDWYGFWNFGDVMHTYDASRHIWRYDVGGYGWDNSELSTDIWLWLYYLRTGRADVFRMAEAMCRHTGEVDVHHVGRFAPLGSRHNVLHWGDSAKQLRISTAANRRYYYYLTGDERVGDLMREQIEAHRTLLSVFPTRKVGGQVPEPNATKVTVSFGTDWGSLAAAWLTEWERTGDSAIRDRLMNSMRTIAAQPRGFFTEAAPMDPDTGVYDTFESDRVSVSHLSAVFGLVEICAELVDLIDMPEFETAWLQYCRLYNGSPEAQRAELDTTLRRNLVDAHSRLTAFAANRLHDDALAAQAWQQLIGRQRLGSGLPRVQTVTGPDVLTPVQESPWISTNATAQWGLAAIQCLALVPEALPDME